MGNCCCFYKLGPDNRSPGNVFGKPANKVLQSFHHISDREDLDSRTGTLFMKESLSNGQVATKGVPHRRHTVYILSTPETVPSKLALRKSNSCSTIYLDDCSVSQPNMRAMLKCVAIAIGIQLSSRTSSSTVPDSIGVFDERLHPLTQDKSFLRNLKPPDADLIYQFLKAVFTTAALNPECAIVTLVYLERLLTLGEIALEPNNWRRILLGVMVLASKVWDDQAVWNVDYLTIFPSLNVDDLNELERTCLELMQFNINVPSSVYARYYFELRALGMRCGTNLQAQPLRRDRAKKLEVISRLCNEPAAISSSGLQRSASVDRLKGTGSSLAVLF